MNSATLLRVASGIALFQYGVHAFLYLTATPSHGRDEIALIGAMKLQHWDFRGFTRSYRDFYFGYGLLAILWGLIEVILIWQLSVLAKISSLRIRPMIVVLFLANVAHAILTLMYFFSVPAIFDFIVAIFLLSAFIKARQNSTT
jgi:hypothetical protein